VNKLNQNILPEKGVKQNWLAEKLGKSFNIVNDYCNNRRQPSLDLINKISEILEVENKELLKSNKK
jgi:putative transcriptional regulator